MTAYQEIIRLLAGLRPDELKKLPGAIAPLLRLTGTPADASGPAPGHSGTPGPEKRTSDEPWLLEAICSEAARVGEHTFPGALVRSSHIGRFRRDMPGLLKFLSADGALNRTEQHALMRLGVRLWYQHRADIARPATAGIFLQQGNVPAIINLNFPGYAKNGLLKLIVSKAPRANTGNIP